MAQHGGTSRGASDEARRTAQALAKHNRSHGEGAAESEKRLHLLGGWVGSLRDIKLDRLSDALQTASEWLGADGVAVLETDPADWREDTYDGGKCHVVGTWHDGKGPVLPTWVHSSNTRAWTVLRPAEKDTGIWPDGYREIPPDDKHSRCNLYSRPARGAGRIADGLFRFNGQEYTVRSAAFFPVELFSRRPSIVCFFSEKNRDSDVFFNQDASMALRILRSTSDLVLQGIAYRLISDVTQILGEATSAMEQDGIGTLDKTMACVPDLIAKALSCGTVTLRMAGTDQSPSSFPLTYSNESAASANLEKAIGVAFRDGKAQLVMDADDEPRSLGNAALSENSSGWLAIPVVEGYQVIAVIACERPLRMPRVFTEWEMILLHIVGAHVARAWTSTRTMDRLAEENRTWKSAVGSLAAANSKAYEVLSGEQLDVGAVLNKILYVISDFVSSDSGEPRDFWVDIRLLDDERLSLRYAAFLGAYWKENSREKDRSFPIDWDAKLNRSLGEYVLKSKRPFFTPDPTDMTTLPENTMATDTIAQQLFVIPILGGDGLPFGVVDIHMPRSYPIPQRLREMAEMLGHQIGLFIFLTKLMQSNVDEREKAVRLFNEANDLQRSHLEVLQNVHHQVDLPMIIALHEIDDLLDNFKPFPLNEFNKLRSARAFVKRSWQASSSTSIFRKLTSGQTLDGLFDLKPMVATRIAFLLQEIAEDYRHTIDAERNIEIKVDTSGFEKRDLRRIRYHEKLLSQVVGNLVDNAAKYSFLGTTVYIIGGVTNKGNLFISVRNRGIPIAPGDASRIRERGFRTTDATHYADGTGIGLWLVERIMAFLDGFLEINPAENVRQYHDFRLVFRMGGAGRGGER
ncbi:MAG: ATP-binding protein [Alphaproteobacteria bacterium]